MCGRLKPRPKNNFVKESQKKVAKYIEGFGKDGDMHLPDPDGAAIIKNLDKLQDQVNDTYKAVRHNKGKPMYSLVPVELEEAAAKSFTQGQEKYPKNNHFKPTDWDVPYDSLRRHLKDFWSGEDFDPDSPEDNRIHHLERAASNLAILLYNLKNNPKGDTRYKGE